MYSLHSIPWGYNVSVQNRCGPYLAFMSNQYKSFIEQDKWRATQLNIATSLTQDEVVLSLPERIQSELLLVNEIDGKLIVTSAVSSRDNEIVLTQNWKPSFNQISDHWFKNWLDISWKLISIFSDVKWFKWW